MGSDITHLDTFNIFGVDFPNGYIGWPAFFNMAVIALRLTRDLTEVWPFGQNRAKNLQILNKQLEAIISIFGQFPGLFLRRAGELDRPNHGSHVTNYWLFVKS